MTEIKLIEANLDSEWSCPADEEFWKDRIGMLVEYVKAAEAFRKAYFCVEDFGGNTKQMNDAWYEARKSLRLEDK